MLIVKLLSDFVGAETSTGWRLRQRQPTEVRIDLSRCTLLRIRATKHSSEMILCIGVPIKVADGHAAIAIDSSSRGLIFFYFSFVVLF